MHFPDMLGMAEAHISSGTSEDHRDRQASFGPVVVAHTQRRHRKEPLPDEPLEADKTHPLPTMLWTSRRRTLSHGLPQFLRRRLHAKTYNPSPPETRNNKSSDVLVV